MTKTPTPTELSEKQRDNIKTPPKTLITQLLQTDLGTYEEQILFINTAKGRYENEPVHID